ncbi:MAG: hypothetical protein ACREEM_26505 [Blastocatellia bacterium]
MTVCPSSNHNGPERKRKWKEIPMNAVLQEQLAPEIVQTIIAQATASGLSVNEFLRSLLGLRPDVALASAPAEAHEDAPPRNEAMLAVLQRTAARLKGMPFSGSTEDSLKILHEGRAGRMYGYEPNRVILPRLSLIPTF